MDKIDLNGFSQMLSASYQDIVSKITSKALPLEKIVEDIIGYYESVISVMPGNVYWLNKDCVTVGCNKNVLDMFGFRSVDDFRGMTFDDMARIGNWTKQAKESFQKDTEDVIKTGEPKLSIEEPPIHHKDGRVLYFLTSRVPLFDKTGKVVGVAGISIDITERKKAEEQLVIAKEKAEAANKAKTEFLENMRHDIRTPLIGISGFASLIADEVKDQKIKEYADNLSASCGALLDLLNEILEVIKVNSGEVPILKKKFDLKKRLLDVINLNQAKARQKQVNLIFDYDKKIPTYVIGDSTRLHRIVLELVANALNFTNTGKVKLSAHVSKKNGREIIIKIIVEDTGIGIAPEKQQEIFLQFKRLTPSYEGIYKGAGLGLTIVKKFLDDMNGEIYVESQEGVGSKFTCILPLKKALLDEKFGSDDVIVSSNLRKTPDSISENHIIKNTTNKKFNSSKNRILVVEDQHIASVVVKSMLFNLDCQIDVAPDGKTAVQLAQENNYDLIFMDIGLPDMNGYEVTKRIRLNELQNGRHVPIIALTAHVDEENKERCLEIGMNAVISKPLEKEKAEDLLNAFIPYRKQRSGASVKLKSQSTSESLEIEGKVVDFESAKKQLGENEELLHQLLAMLANEIPGELKKIKAAHKNGDWESVGEIAHKLKGGASYCGAVRLQAVCGRLESAIKREETKLANALYNILLEEVSAAEKAVRNKSY